MTPGYATTSSSTSAYVRTLTTLKTPSVLRMKLWRGLGGS